MTVLPGSGDTRPPDTSAAREFTATSSSDMAAISVQLGLLSQDDSTGERLLRNTQVAR
jgi:hypothetical protein